MQTIPDAPISLINVAAITDVTKIGLSWKNGKSNGGSVITSYTISYAKVSESTFTEVLGTTITATQYTTNFAIEASISYKFKVRAISAIG